MVPWSWKLLYALLCFQYALRINASPIVSVTPSAFHLSTLFTSKICKESSFLYWKAWPLFYDCSLPCILCEHKHIKYLYIPPIYRKVSLGDLKTDSSQMERMWEKCPQCAGSELQCLPSTVPPLITGCSAEWALVCQDSKRSCLRQSNKALTDSGICRATTECIKPMFPQPHCEWFIVMAVHTSMYRGWCAVCAAVLHRAPLTSKEVT